MDNGEVHDAERRLLGAMLLSPELVADVVAAMPHGRETFDLPAHATVYEALVACASGIEPGGDTIVPVVEQLTLMGRLQTIGGPLFLGELTTGVTRDVWRPFVATLNSAAALRIARVGTARMHSLLERGDHDGYRAELARQHEAIERPGWQGQFMRSPGGDALCNEHNLGVVLRNDPEFRGLAFDVRRVEVLFRGEPLSEGSFGLLLERMQRRWFERCKEAPLKRAISTVARERECDDVRDYLATLTWDGVLRLSTLAARALGATDRLSATMLRAWMVSAVARAFKPGSKADVALVLVGSQGARKSSFFRELVGDRWFCDSPVWLGNKDAYLTIRQGWVCELAEIDGLTSRKEASDLKSFMSTAADTFRPPFGTAAAKFPRAMVFCGTTNETHYLADATGSRRFWTITVPGDVNIDLVRADRDQLWAEAVVAFRAGEQWWLGKTDDIERDKQARGHVTADPWQEFIARWLANHPDARPTAAELLRDAVGVDPQHMNRASETRVGGIMHGLGWQVRQVRRDGARVRVYEPTAGCDGGYDEENLRLSQPSPPPEAALKAGCDGVLPHETQACHDRHTANLRSENTKTLSSINFSEEVVTVVTVVTDRENTRDSVSRPASGEVVTAPEVVTASSGASSALEAFAEEPEAIGVTVSHGGGSVPAHGMGPSLAHHRRVRDLESAPVAVLESRDRDETAHENRAGEGMTPEAFHVADVGSRAQSSVDEGAQMHGRAREGTSGQPAKASAPVSTGSGREVA